MSKENRFRENWWLKSWKWLVPSAIIIICAVLIYSIIGNLSKNFVEPSLYDEALNIAKQNERVKSVLGGIAPIGRLDFESGSIHYSDDYNRLEFTVRLKSYSARAQMEVLAERQDYDWVYKKITVHIEEPAETINVLE